MNTSNSDEKVVLPKMIERLVMDDAKFNRFMLVLGTMTIVAIIAGIVQLAMI